MQLQEHQDMMCKRYMLRSSSKQTKLKGLAWHEALRQTHYFVFPVGSSRQAHPGRGLRPDDNAHSPFWGNVCCLIHNLCRMHFPNSNKEYNPKMIWMTGTSVPPYRIEYVFECIGCFLRHNGAYRFHYSNTVIWEQTSTKAPPRATYGGLNYFQTIYWTWLETRDWSQEDFGTGALMYPNRSVL